MISDGKVVGRDPSVDAILENGLGPALKAAADSAAPPLPDFGKVYARAEERAVFGSGRPEPLAAPLRRLRASVLAAGLVIIVGAAAFLAGRLGGFGSEGSLPPDEAYAGAASEPELAAVLVDSPLDVDMGSFVADLFEETSF